jgi:hypothetical protein
MIDLYHQKIKYPTYIKSIHISYLYLLSYTTQFLPSIVWAEETF